MFDMVTSFFEGRVRLRAEIFRDPETAEDISLLLRSVKGVENFNINPVTGSLLIEYDAAKLPLSKIKKALPVLEDLKNLYEAGADGAEIRPVLKKLQTALI